MRFFAVFTAALVGVALIVGTGVGGGEKKDAKAKGQLRPGWKELNLTEAQREKVYNIQSAYKGKYAELQAQMKKLQASQLQDELAVLNEVQRDQLRRTVAGDAAAPKAKEPDKK